MSRVEQLAKLQARVGYTASPPGANARTAERGVVGCGVSKTFSDTMSGVRDDRPGLNVLMEYVREGDNVVVWKRDRLGRNTLHIL